MGSGEPARRRGQLHVTVLGSPLTPAAVAAIAGRIAASGANIDRIDRLAHRPVTCIEFDVSGADPEALRVALAREATQQGVDVAVQRGGLHRRAMRLVVMDVDSTLIAAEVIDLLAAQAGCAGQMAKITEATMRGELDFATSLRERVSMLAGLDESVLDQVRGELRLAPGARTLIRTLHRLGYRCGIVSGGFTQITDPLAAELGIDYAAANTLEISGGQADREADRARHRPGREGRRAAPVRRAGRRRGQPGGGGRRRRQRPGHDRRGRPRRGVQRPAGGPGRGGRVGQRPLPGHGAVPAGRLPRRSGGRGRRRPRGAPVSPAGPLSRPSASSSRPGSRTRGRRRSQSWRRPMTPAAEVGKLSPVSPVRLSDQFRGRRVVPHQGQDGDVRGVSRTTASRSAGSA